MSMNIQGTDAVEDLHYRYKMPRLLIKHEGKGNGKSTVITNLEDIGRSLNRPAKELLHYLSKELGARGSIEDNSKYVLRGWYTVKALQERLSFYIDAFVLCLTCSNPETQYRIKLRGKSGTVSLKCAACGSENKVDWNHSLCKKIMKDYAKDPISSRSKKKGKLKGSKKKRDGEKCSKKNHDDGEEGRNDICSSSSVQTQIEKRKGSKKKHNSENCSKKKQVDGEEGRNNICSSSSVQTQIDVSDSPKSSSYCDEELKQAIAAFQNFAEVGTKSNDLLDEAKRLEHMGLFPSGTHIEIFVKGLFERNIRVRFKDRIDALRDICSDPSNSFRLICCLEALTINNPQLLNSFSLLLKDFYDADILDEEAILRWGNRFQLRSEFTCDELSDENLRHLLQVSKPLFNWLEHAEFESEDGGSNDD